MRRSGHALVRQGPYLSPSSPGQRKVRSGTPGSPAKPRTTGLERLSRPDDALEALHSDPMMHSRCCTLQSELLAAERMAAARGNTSLANSQAEDESRSYSLVPSSSPFRDLLAREFKDAECRLLELYLFQLVRRQERILYTNKRLERPDLDHDDEEDDDLDPADQKHLQHVSNKHNLHVKGRHRALWHVNPTKANHFVGKLSSRQLEQLLVDLLLTFVGPCDCTKKKEHLRDKGCWCLPGAVYGAAALHMPNGPKGKKAKMPNLCFKQSHFLRADLYRLERWRTDLKRPYMKASQDSTEDIKIEKKDPLPDTHGELYERDELEKLVAKMLTEHRRASIELQRFCRSFCSYEMMTENHERWKNQDMGANRIKAWWRRVILRTAIEKIVPELRRKAIMKNLGAESCLDEMSMAKDGDTIFVPKGRHYPRLTNLADGMSLTQTYMLVRDASQVRIGSVLIVGKERMHVLSKQGYRVDVQRQTPSEILKVLVSGCEMQDGERIKRGRFQEVLDLLYEDLTLDSGNFDENTWVSLCQRVASKCPLTKEKSEMLWRWWIDWEDPNRPAFPKVLHRHLDASKAARNRPVVLAVGHEGIEEVKASADFGQGLDTERELELDEALDAIDRWWISNQKTGRFRLGEEMMECPQNCLEPESKDLIKMTLRNLYDATVRVTKKAITGFLCECIFLDGPCRRLKNRRVVSRKRWLVAAAPLLRGDLTGASDCVVHDMGTVVRGETTIRVSSLINIQADGDAEIMGSMLFARDPGVSKLDGVPRLFSVSGEKDTADSSQLYVLYETAPEVKEQSINETAPDLLKGGCRPLRLVNKTTGIYVWSKEMVSHPEVQRSFDGALWTDEHVEMGHAWQFPCVSCKGANQLLHQILLDSTEVRGKIDKLHVRSRLGDGMRFSFGKWELSDCIIEAEGVSQGNSALVCGFSARISISHSILGGMKPTAPFSEPQHVNGKRDMRRSHATGVDKAGKLVEDSNGGTGKKGRMAAQQILKSPLVFRDGLVQGFSTLVGILKKSLDGLETTLISGKGHNVVAHAETQGQSAVQTEVRQSSTVAGNAVGGVPSDRQGGGHGAHGNHDNMDAAQLFIREGTNDDLSGFGACKHVILASDGTEQERATIELEQCVLQNSHHSALCCGPFSNFQVQGNTMLHHVQRVWTDSFNIPRDQEDLNIPRDQEDRWRVDLDVEL